MEPRQLFLEDGTLVKPHLCGKCNRVWDSLESADRCCTCHYCGQYCSLVDAGVSHLECQRTYYAEKEAEALSKATLDPNYDGPFLWGDRIYMSAEAFVESVGCDNVPEFGFCAKFSRPHLSESDIVDSLADGMHEYWEPEAVPELTSAIAAWNEANEDNGSYWEDRERKWSKAEILTLIATEKGKP